MHQPLAYRMRPRTIEEIVGQQHLIGYHQILRKCVENGTLFSMIFFGPPGCGKTTTAMVLCESLHRPYRFFNAVNGTKKDLDALFLEAKVSPGLVVIIDEVHRLNKDKQDLLLPHIENGNLIMIGATTTNPYHSINPAIRSRTHLLEFYPLKEEDVFFALQNACTNKRGLPQPIHASEEALRLIANRSGGDIRYALNQLELCAFGCENNVIEKTTVECYCSASNQSIGKEGDSHYDILSAFQKSIRGSDVDAALYYLAILIEANDMESIERRLLTCAYEDVGLANPAACARCVSAIDAAKRIGFPEARIPLAHTVIDLALSPKSKSSETAIDQAISCVHRGYHPMPPYLKFTPVGIREEERYDYENSSLWDRLQYLPETLKDQQFYQPQLSSQYEKILASNWEKLKRIPRSSDIKKVKRGHHS